MPPSPPAPEPQSEPTPRSLLQRVPTWGWVVAILAVAAFVRLWEINALGYNSDEAVYSGQGASIAGVDALEPYFPAFRAHPLLSQTLLAVGYELGGGELFGRVLFALIGVLTVYVVYRIGDLLYNRQAGLVAALFMALMPYHVVVTRQVLLDGPETFCAAVTLYLLARYGRSRNVAWLYAAGAGMGITFLAKETGIVLLGSVYAFIALTPELRVRLGQLLKSVAVMAAFVAVFPLALLLAGQTETGGNFLAWQLFRRPNHSLTFYATEVPEAIGFLVVIAAVVGLWRIREWRSWRETLLLTWIIVPVVFFELWAVKGFQYLLPIAPAVAILAARALTASRIWTPFVPQPGSRFERVVRGVNRLREPRIAAVAIAVVALSLAVPTWNRINPSDSASFLAGSGGVPGGRETGEWIADNVPEGSRIMTIGPSMANIVQFYGRRQANGLSVSPNPLNRNPVYDPLLNPDRLIRDNEVQYAVWDAFSAERSPFFSAQLRSFVDRYHGRLLHSETIPVKTASGETTQKPIISVFEVRP